MQENKTKIRKVFLEELPRFTDGRYKGKINWLSCITLKVKFIYEDVEGWIEIINYDISKRFLKLKYLDTIIDMSTNSFKRCELGKKLGKITGDFKIEKGTRYKDEKRDMTIIDMKYRDNLNNKGTNLKWYKYHCNICGWDEGWIIESDIVRKRGCTCCNGNTVIEGINDIPTTAPFMIPYFQGGFDEAKLYTKFGGGNPNNKLKTIFPICPDCGRIKSKKVTIKSIYFNHSIACPCSDSISYPNKTMFNVLEQLGTDFISEYSPEWISPKRFDFYIPLINKIIEMDGGLGHGNKVHKKSKLTSEESLEIDNYKDKMANEHNIEVIRIDCVESDAEYIKNKILKSKLANILDLSNINWNKVDEFACSNRVKEACEYKRNNPNIGTMDISILMKLAQCTIIKYLKRGNEIWDWCNYNTKEELIKNGNKSSQLNKKPVEIFKDGISLGIFETAKDLENKSEKLFGVKLNKESISEVCRNKREQYKGYIFKFA